VGSPDNPVNFSHGTLSFPESSLFIERVVHCPVHTGHSGAPRAGASLIRSIFIELAKGSVGGMLRHRRSCKKKHLRQILSKAVPKLSPIKLRHSHMSQDEGVNRLKDEMTNRPMIACIMIVSICKGHECNFSQAASCAYK
jgi:hypothetical protein